MNKHPYAVKEPLLKQKYHKINKNDNKDKHKDHYKMWDITLDPLNKIQIKIAKDLIK
jgi:hypothetical protein